jgi:hypothetical protein
MALNYVPQQAWKDWCQLLNDNKLFFRQHVHACGFQRTIDRLEETEHWLQQLKQCMDQFGA